MQITKKEAGKYVVISISGQLDMNNVKIAKQTFDEVVNNGAKFVAIDMKDLQYIDSSGIGSFIGLMSKLRSAGGQVVLFNMTEDIKRIFSMTKLLGFFTVYANEQDFLSKSN